MTPPPFETLMHASLLERELGPEGGPPVVAGKDIALIEDDRIATLYTVLVPPPTAPA